MSDHPHAVDEQAELIPGLLEGASPDAYVVMPISALTTQVLIAIRETVDRDGRVRPGKVSMRLARSLSVLGFIVDTKHDRPDMDIYRQDGGQS